MRVRYLSMDPTIRGWLERDTYLPKIEEGAVIAPDLFAVRLLGGGRRYEAYLAWDDALHALVVVKIVRPKLVEAGAGLTGLTAEARALEALNHPTVVRMFDAVLDGDRPHIVLEHLEGPRLSSLIRRQGPLPEQQYLPLAIELSSALHYLGRLGYVHLDIKPSNVIMGAPAKLIDLSLARTVEEARGLTHEVGTDSYMAPEQCDPSGSSAPPGPASDVWGLGAALYQAIEGMQAFPDGDPDSDFLVERFPQLELAPRPFTRRVAVDVAEVVVDCLSPDPRDRPSPREVAERLEPALSRAPRGRLTFKVR